MSVEAIYLPFFNFTLMTLISSSSSSSFSFVKSYGAMFIYSNCVCVCVCVRVQSESGSATLLFLNDGQKSFLYPGLVFVCCSSPPSCAICIASLSGCTGGEGEKKKTIDHHSSVIYRFSPCPFFFFENIKEEKSPVGRRIHV